MSYTNYWGSLYFSRQLTNNMEHIMLVFISVSWSHIAVNKRWILWGMTWNFFSPILLQPATLQKLWIDFQRELRRLLGNIGSKVQNGILWNFRNRKVDCEPHYVVIWVCTKKLWGFNHLILTNQNKKIVKIRIFQFDLKCLQKLLVSSKY